MADLGTVLGSIRMATPLVAVSGTFGVEYITFPGTMLGIGAVVAKSVTQRAREGNAAPRIVEIDRGIVDIDRGRCLLNSIGLHNPGIDGFIRHELPKYRNIGVPLIASIAGETKEEYAECARRAAGCQEVAGIELNVSCPNVAKGGLAFGCDASGLQRLVEKVRKAVGDATTLIVKLTPNVTDIAGPAAAAIDGGASAIAVINTLRGMAIDLHTRRPKLGNEIGGVSGTIIHPVAVYMVARCYHACCRKHKIPIIGMGGVMNGEDAVELILAGATCVGIGSALFKTPEVFGNVARGIGEYMDKNNFKRVSHMVGCAIGDRRKRHGLPTNRDVS
jgi:dihydroorotate dehydrogenase (NAD+) catalytic subunit